MIYTCSIDTPLGTMTAAEKDEALIGLWFIGQKYYPASTTGWVCEPGRPVFVSTGNYLVRYFAGEAGPIDFRLAPSGSPFRIAVWDRLMQIPMGQVITYGNIARSVDRTRGSASMSAQAVGGAVGHNPISILIPCHRVIGSDGSLTGYAGGLDRKAALLRIEQSSHLFEGVPRHGHL
jgi:methylated-DNA-[protein]-cysteine S-methyltransferase